MKLTYNHRDRSENATDNGNAVLFGNSINFFPVGTMDDKIFKISPTILQPLETAMQSASLILVASVGATMWTFLSIDMILTAICSLLVVRRLMQFNL